MNHILNYVFDALVNSTFSQTQSRLQINTEACSCHENFIILQLVNGRRFLVTCADLDDDKTDSELAADDGDKADCLY